MLSRFAAAVVAVNLCACVIEPVPIEAPARVVITDRDVTDQEVELIKKAAAVWNGARTGVVVSVERGKERALECGVIYVSRMHGSKCPDGDDAIACTYSDGCTGETLLPSSAGGSDATFVAIAAHEIGHSLLGPAHSPDRQNVMSVKSGKNPAVAITAEQAAAIHF